MTDPTERLQEAEAELADLREIAREIVGFDNGGFMEPGVIGTYLVTLRVIANNARNALEPRFTPAADESEDQG